MVLSSEFRMNRYRDDDHWEKAPHIIGLILQGPLKSYASQNDIKSRFQIHVGKQRQFYIFLKLAPLWMALGT